MDERAFDRRMDELERKIGEIMEREMEKIIDRAMQKQFNLIKQRQENDRRRDENLEIYVKELREKVQRLLRYQEAKEEDENQFAGIRENRGNSSS